MKIIRWAAGTLALCCASAPSSAVASPIVGVLSATASPASEGGVFGPASALIDQSGLSANYVAGVTDFDAFTASTTATYCVTTCFQELSSIVGVVGSYWQFDFGSAVSIDAIALWNQSGAASLDTFTVQTSLVPDFSISQTFGAFTMVPFTGAVPSSANVFDFTPTAARYARINVLSNAGYSGATRLNEVVFESVRPMPEPTSVLLFGSGAIGFVARRRRRRSAGVCPERQRSSTK